MWMGCMDPGWLGGGGSGQGGGGWEGPAGGTPARGWTAQAQHTLAHPCEYPFLDQNPKDLEIRFVGE